LNLNKMLRHFKYLILSFIVYVFLSSSSLADSENLIRLNLDLKQKIQHITCCNFEGAALKDIVATDGYTITIFRQNPNHSFKAYTIKSNDQIMAVNSCRINRAGKEILMCLGKNKIFYFSLTNHGEIKGPDYIKVLNDKSIFLKKQKSMKNYSFVVDLNNDGLDDIVIPTEEGLLISWQIEPLVFDPSLIKIEYAYINSSLNIQPWPKFGEKNKKHNNGISFFPTLSKKRYYWLQDYNKDKLLDIISFAENSDGCRITIFLQEKNKKFQAPKYINLPNSKHQNWSAMELRLLDLNNDGLIDIIGTNIEYPLKGNTSLLPLLISKIYFAEDTFKFNFQPSNIFKSVCMPKLDNVINLDNDGHHAIITITPPLKLESKESIIKAAENKEITFNLGYYAIKKNKSLIYVTLSKDFSMALLELTELYNFRQFIRFEDMTGDGVPDILLLKKTSLLELTKLKKVTDMLSIDKTINIPLFYSVVEVRAIDINSDSKKELLILGPDSKRICVIYLKEL